MGCVCSKKPNVKRADIYKEKAEPTKNPQNLIEQNNNNIYNKPAENLKSDTPNNSKIKKKHVSNIKKSEESESPRLELNEKLNLLNFEEDKPIEDNFLKGSFLKEGEKNNNNSIVQNKSILPLHESTIHQNNNYSSIRTPTYAINSEKKLNEQKYKYRFLEKIALDPSHEEEFYYELYDSDLIDFHENLVNQKTMIKNPLSSFSNFNDWSKLIQKASLPPDKLTESMAKVNQDSIQEVFRVILSLKERNWYEEITQLYKEKNSAKFNQNMFGMNFDRKIVHIQEHFKWFLASIAHFCFNFNTVVGSTNFQPQCFQIKNKSKTNSNISNNLIKSYNMSDVQDSETNNFNKTNKSIAQNMIMDLRLPENSLDPDNHKGPFHKYLPHHTSPIWFQGFIWRGVYLKMFSRVDGKTIKAEIKGLKNLAIEYLQTENSFKIDFQKLIKEKIHDNSFLDANINKPNDQNNNFPFKYINFILPLICYIESPSWVLLGTPLIFNKKHGHEELKIHDISQYFKKSLYLNNLSNQHLKFHFTNYEETSTVFQTPNSSATFMNPNNLNSIINNVKTLIPRQDPVYLMYLINQDPNTNIVYFDTPETGELDINSIKQLMGYHAFSKVDHSNLMNGLFKEDSRYTSNILKESNALKGSTYEKNDTLFLDIIHFEYLDWKFQMIYASNIRNSPMSCIINERAMEMLQFSSHDNKKKIKIFGNVLIFASNLNEFSYILSPIINDQEILSYFLKKSHEGIYRVPKIEKKIQFKPSYQENQKFSEKNDGNFYENLLINHYLQSIEEIANKIDTTDEILNPAALKELFHKSGLNMRFEWIVYSKLRNMKAKGFLGSDILCRVLKKKINYQIHKKIQDLKNTLGEMSAEESNDRNEIMSESLFKTILAKILSLLLIGESKIIEENFIYKEIMLCLSYSLLRILNYTNKLLLENELYVLLSTQILKELISLPSTESNTFINFAQYHFKISFDYELINSIRTDKYHFLLNKNHNPITPKEIFSLNYSSISYLTLRERAYIILIRQSYNKISKYNFEHIVPCCLYKIKTSNNLLDNTSIFNTNSLDSQLKYKYSIPDIDVLNDWVLCLEIICNGLQCLEGDNTVLLEAYILQILETYFLEQDEEQCKIILEKLVNYLNVSLLCEPEIVVIVHTLLGLIYETKALVECEQNYMMALLTLHKLHGDPRGRGAAGIPWELFVTWRLSIITRLQSKIHDAEYVEELYDATVLNLKRNRFNNFASKHYIYDYPFKPYESSFNSNKYLYSPTKKPNINSEIKDIIKENSKNLCSPNPFEYEGNSQFNTNNLPGFFTHWSKHLKFEESTSKMEILNQTLAKNEETFAWILKNLLIFSPSKILWQTSYLKSFFLSIMQSVYTSTSTVSSLSNYSLRPEKQMSKDHTVKESNEGGNYNATPKNTKTSKKNKTLTTVGGNLVQVFEKDSSTYNKKDLSGVAFVWGQNVEGQLGVIIDGEEDQNNWNPNFDKKLKIMNPRLLLPLKNTIIKSVACGYTHSIAITINQNVLAWGSNKSSQLGLGPNTPSNVTIPTQIPKLENIIQVSCGHEHTIALDSYGNVFSWGQGEGGLLGHNDTKTLNSPKLIEGLRNIIIDSICCGGLHTLALSRNGLVYAWGRGEGGQLGLAFNLLTNEDGNLYLTTPKRIRANLEGSIVKQIACGDAHSLALLQNGRVFGWGYTNSGQLGLGITGDTLEGNPKFNSIQIREPVMIESLISLNITKIYAGSTFSMFLTDKKELYSCGINDYNQLGVEKNPIKITNNTLDNYRNPANNLIFSECAIPKKLECFQQIPILNVACGENHSIAMTLFDNKYYMLFSWGMHKHNQLGLGDIGLTSSPPRPITYLQDMVFYSMGCGAYHTIALAGYPLEPIDFENLMIKKIEKYDSKWNLSYYDIKDNYSNVMEFAFSNLENITPSDEGKIDNPKSIKTVN